MLKKLMVTLGYGLLWLMLFSLPVGMNRRLFDVAWYYIVDTAPVNWAASKLTGGVNATKDVAAEAKETVVRKVDDKLTRADDSIQEARAEEESIR